MAIHRTKAVVVNSTLATSFWDVAVVGGGIGGLTAGALLASAGARVVICEQHSRPGGYCHSWSRAVRYGGKRIKFTFDAAVHDISGAYQNGPIQKILGWLELNEQFEWCRVSHEYCLPTMTLRVNEDPDAYISALKQRFSSDKVGIDRFFSIFRDSYDELFYHTPLTGGLPRAPRNSEEMRLFRERCPTLAKFIGVPFVEMRDSLLRDPDLRKLVSVLAAYVTDDVCQMSFANMLPLFSYYFRGGYYPRGGSQALADALVKRIKDYGGLIQLRTPVAKIKVEDGRARGLILNDGTQLRADTVISNADPAQTFRQLLDINNLPVSLANAATSFRPSNSAFMVFLALDMEPSIASSTIISREQDGVIISHPPFPEERAPAGYSTLTLTSLVGADDVKKWNRKSCEYQQMKREVGDHLIGIASYRVPDIAKRIVYREEGSPATLQRYTWATDCAAYGSTPSTRFPSHETPIKGLYVVGAATGLGPGIEAVMIGAASLVELLGGRSICSGQVKTDTV